MRIYLIIGCLITSLVVTVSCNKKDTAPFDPCNGVTYAIQFSKTESVGTSSNGTLTILAPRNDSLFYQLNNGTYQASWYFTNLAPGSYIIRVKNSRNCTDTAQVTILNYGPKYALVKQIILGYCGPCHLNGGISGSMNFDTDLNIVSARDRIRIRTVDGLPSYMPENSQLTNPDKQKIVDWINAGGTVGN
jgi:hypothetical protein